jgi:hypothetical protein
MQHFQHHMHLSFLWKITLLEDLIQYCSPHQNFLLLSNCNFVPIDSLHLIRSPLQSLLLWLTSSSSTIFHLLTRWVKPFSSCLCMPCLFHLTQCPPVPSMLLQITGIPFFMAECCSVVYRYHAFFTRHPPQTQGESIS